MAFKQNMFSNPSKSIARAKIYHHVISVIVVVVRIQHSVRDKIKIQMFSNGNIRGLEKINQIGAFNKFH